MADLGVTPQNAAFPGTFRPAAAANARRRLRRLAAAAGITSALMLAGCDTLSRDGPSPSSIESGAVTSVRNPDASKPVLSYILLDVDQTAIANFGSSIASSLFDTFGGQRGPAPEIKVGVGDILQVTIFESQAGGLFIPQEAGSRAGNFVTIPAQQVDRRGTLTVPYAGDVPAIGKSIPELQKDIEKALSTRAIEPQVILSLGTQRSSQVSVVGDVNAPNKIDVNPAGDRILDVIAKAGGPISPGYETYVTLQRGNRKATVYFDAIIANPRENIFLRPGDTVYVYREPQTFLAFGATGGNGSVNFGAPKLSLGEGVAKAGGLLDTRADPSQVYLYRMVGRTALVKAKVDVSKFPVDQGVIPVVFKANFRDPTSYFAAQHFQMADKDVLYVSNSASYELYKFLDLLNNTSNTVANVPANLNTAKQSVRALGH